MLASVPGAADKCERIASERLAHNPEKLFFADTWKTFFRHPFGTDRKVLM
jgi:hypothetical protein